MFIKNSRIFELYGFWRQYFTHSKLCREGVGEAFLGFANYYLDFLPDFANLTAELNTVKTKCVIEWKENMVNDFQKVTNLFSGAQHRAAPDYSEHALPLILTFDFFKVSIGAVLS